VAVRLDTASGRARLKPGNNPHYQRLRRGLALGLRVHASGGGTWSARVRTEEGYEQRVLDDITDGYGFDEARVAAEAWAAEIESGVRGRDASGKAASVEAACREYVEACRVESAERAHEADMAFRRRVYGYTHVDAEKRRQPNHDAHPIARRELAKLREVHLRTWRDEMVKTVGKSTANRNLTRLKAALNHAVKTRLAGPNLAHEIRHVLPFENAAKRRELFLDRAQRQALLAAASGSLRDLIEAAAYTGARPGELVKLLRSAFDARTASITFRGKTGSRTVPLSPAASALFARLAKDKLPLAPLLTRDDGKPWAHSDWDELIRDAAARASLPPGVVLYTLRHAFITEALLSGMATLEVGRLVGTSVQMIEKHYGHLVADKARERLAAVHML
jgi:integrase